VREGVRGELTLVIAGAPEPEVEEVDEDVVVAAVEELVAAGASTRDAVARVAVDRGMRRRDLYAVVTQRRSGPARDDQ